MSYTNSNPGWATGYEPKATEWASTWSGKVDAVGGFANNLNVGTGAFVNLSVTGSLNVSGGAAFSGDGSLITFKSTGTTTARSLASRGAEIFNVLDFGADPTGVADSTTAIQAAINAAQASAANGPPPLNGAGGSIDGIAFKAVYLPPGQYTTSYPLIISYPVLFLGEGAKSVTILSANPAYPILAVVPQYLTGHDYYDGDGIVGYIKIANICFKGAPAVTTVTSDGQYININQDGHALFFGQAATNPCYCRIDVEDIIIWGAPCDGLSAEAPLTSAVRTAIGAANATFIGYLYVVNLTVVAAGRYGFAMADADDWRLDGADISYSGASNILVTGGGGQGTSDVNCYFAGLNPAWSGEYNLANNPPTPQKTIVTGPGTSIAYTANAWLPNHAYGVVGTQVQNGGNAYYLDTAGTSASSGGPTGTSSGVNTIIDGTAKWHYLGVVAPVSVYGSAYNVCLFGTYEDIDFYNCKIDCTSYGGVYIYLDQACEVRIVGGCIASGQGSNPSAGNYPAVYVAATNGNNQIKLTNVRMEPPHSYSPTTGFVNYTVQFAAGIVQTISMLQCTMPWGLGAATNAPALIDVERGGVFNVLDFGADPTGQTDSTAAIQAAVTAAQSSLANFPTRINLALGSYGGAYDGWCGKRVYLPAGQYLVSNTLIITYPLVFQGDGGKSTVIVSNNITTPIIAVLPTCLPGYDTSVNYGVQAYFKISGLSVTHIGTNLALTLTSDGQYINTHTDGHGIFLGQPTANNINSSRIDIEDCMIFLTAADGLSCYPPLSSTVCAAIGCSTSNEWAGWVNGSNLTIEGSGRHGLNVASADDWHFVNCEFANSGGSNVVLSGAVGPKFTVCNMFGAALNKAWNGWYNLSNNPPTPATTTVNGHVVPSFVAAYNVDIYQAAGGLNIGDVAFVDCEIDTAVYGGIRYQNYGQAQYTVRFIGGNIGDWQGSNTLAGIFPSVTLYGTGSYGRLIFTAVQFEPPHAYDSSGYVSNNFYFNTGCTHTVSVSQCPLPWGLSNATNKPAQIDTGRGGVFNVLDFGADNTGANDSTAAIQACITAAQTAIAYQGGTVATKVNIPPGNYTISSTFNITANSVIIEGGGSGNTALNAVGSACFQLFNVSPPYGGVSIKGLALVNYAGYSSASTVNYAIKMGTTAVNGYFHDLQIQGFDGGIYDEGSGNYYDTIWITLLKTTYGIGMNINNANQPIANNITILGAIGGAGGNPCFACIACYGSGMQMSNSELEGGEYCYLITAAASTAAGAPEISNTYFDQATVASVYYNATASGSSITLGQFSNCWFGNTHSGATGGLLLSGTITDTLISGCQFGNVNGDGIHLTDSSSITGTVISGGAMTAITGTGLYIGTNVSDVTVTGMRIGPDGAFSAPPNGITIASGTSDKLTFVGCNVLGCTTPFTDGGSGTNKIYLSQGIPTILPSALAITSGGPTITTGSAAASGTQPKGSIYLRTGGGVGTTMYVSQGAGTWNAVAGV